MADAHLGSITITSHSGSKVWWSSCMCRTGQPHRWQAQTCKRVRGNSCPYDSGKAGCPCNDLAHNHPEVASTKWDWEASGKHTRDCGSMQQYKRQPDGVVSVSTDGASLSCTPKGTGCPQCAHDARRAKARQPTISSGAPDLLAEWDWGTNGRCGWRPDQVTLGSAKKVHWVVQDDCKLGLVYRWQAVPSGRVGKKYGSPFPSGKAVCACISLAVQCPEAADLWDLSFKWRLDSQCCSSTASQSCGLEESRRQAVGAEGARSCHQCEKTAHVLTELTNEL